MMMAVTMVEQMEIQMVGKTEYSMADSKVD